MSPETRDANICPHDATVSPVVRLLDNNLMDRLNGGNPKKNLKSVKRKGNSANTQHTQQKKNSLQ